MRSALLIALLGLMAGTADAANDWVNLLAQDPTGGLVAGHICYTTNGHDLSCDAVSPAISGTTFIVSGTVSATAYYGDGSHLTGISTASGDRIVSGTLSAIANSATGYISLTTGATNWGYLSGAQSYIPIVSMSTAGVSNTLTYGAMNIANVRGGGGNWIVSGSASVSTSSANGGTVQIAISTGPIVTVTGSNVGILTTTPSGRLSVSGTDGPAYESSIGLGANRDIYLRAGKVAGKIVLGDQNTGNVELGSIGSSVLVNGKLGIGTTSPQNLLSVGAIAGQSNALVTARGGSTGNAFEWGHQNTGGYGNVLGFDNGGGSPFICFSCEAGTTNNTYRTRGILGSVIKGNLGGGISFGEVAGANADNQTLTQLMSITAGGVLTVNGSSTCTIGNGTGATNCTSDRRLKRDITPITDALEKISRLKGVTFRWKDPRKSGPQHIGVIAQDVEKVFPQAVGEVSDTKLGSAKTVDIAALVAPLIEAVKELKTRNDDLQRQVNQLKAQMNSQ